MFFEQEITKETEVARKDKRSLASISGSFDRVASLPVVAAKVFPEDSLLDLQCDETGLKLGAYCFAKFQFRGIEKWRLELKAAKKRMVAVRGLRFFNGAREMYPQLVPAYALEDQ